ncbi:MAG: type III secretion system chaperone [Pseudomonadota bacterium]
MDFPEQVTNVLDDLARAYGLVDLDLDSQGRVSLRRHEVVLTLSYSDVPLEGLTIFVDLGTLPMESAPALNYLLELNYLAWTANLMSIGLDASGDRAIGQFVVPLSCIERQSLQAQLTDMIKAAQTIRQRLAAEDYVIH